MSSVFTSSRLMFFVMVIVVLLTFTIDSFNSAPIINDENEHINNNLTKRAFHGDMTWYHLGLGACGKYNTDRDLACALPIAQFDRYTPNGNPNKNTKCGKRIKVTRGKKSVVVRVVDRCEGCKSGDIDLSPAAFEKLASLSVGRTKCSWKYI
ncbi:11457_t:CDS:2 [Diversispora eburnea]|uniref:11457_t:CDS:1 n=1 Tax=Diversispora eburnea TaxID=1213867 RepID=A0A9N9C1T4_9GLOM|nr:11457_t:CDS:2 [Diversispora eburnea]